MEQGNQQRLDLQATKQACVDSFAVYARLMQEDGWFDPTHEYLCNWTQKHIEKLEEQLAATGTCNGRLLYVMPRGSLKSTIVTKHLTTWLTIRWFYKHNDSSLRSLIAGNTFTNAKKKLRGLRGVFDDVDLFKVLFPEMLPSKKNQWSDEGACINRKGSFDEATFECAGTNTKITGRHYNVILEDDTTAPDVDEMKEEYTIPSAETIAKAIGFHKASMPLQVPKGLRLSIIVSTRWAMSDLVSHVQQEEDYNYFDMPATKNGEIDGEPVFSFYDYETMNVIRKRIGDYMFSCLYLNKPIDDTLRVFRSCDMDWVSKGQVPNTGEISIAVDPAISEKDDACQSAITVNLHHENERKERHEYWLEDYAGRVTPFKLAEKILKLADKYDTEDTPVTSIIVETVAYQEALKYILINMMNLRKKRGVKTYNIVKAKRGNKAVRIEGMQPAFQQGRIHFVRGAMSDETESQLLQWPNGTLVDIIDSWSMHRKVWQSERFGLPDEPEQEDPVETFESVYAEILAMKEGDKTGLMHNIPTGIGQGLTPSGQFYY
jgi:hypothetical protein